MSYVKSIRNSATAAPNEVSEIVNSIPNDNPVKSLSRIMNIYTQPHLYLDQWKVLRVELDCLKRIIAMIRRYETSGLQLDGKGLWLLSMILEYGCNDLTIDSPTLTVLFDTLLRVGVETSAYTVSSTILLLLIKNYQASTSRLFQTGYEIADQLPDHIPTDNFIALLNLAIVCIKHDPTCTLLACKFLVCMAANVTPNHKVNYFLPSIVSAFGEVFMHDTPEEEANPDLKREIEVYVLVLLTYFPPLYPTHAQIIMEHTISLPTHAVHRLREGTFSEAGESAALLFLDSLCIDTTAKDELKELISIDLLRSKMTIYSPTVTEKATKLFLSLYANDIECNYRARSSVDLRGSSSGSSNNLRALGSPSTDRNNNGSEDPLLAATMSSRSDRSYSISGVTCLRDLLGIILTITENALGATSGSTKSETRTPERNSIIGDWSPPKVGRSFNDGNAGDDEISSSAAFHYMNSIVYQVGLCVHIHRIHSLHDIVARIVSLILAQFENMAEFDLKNAKIIDTLFTLMGMRERCWLPYPTDPIDVDFLQLSGSLQEHFLNVADPVVTDATADSTLPCASEAKDYTTSNLLNSKVISFAQNKFLKEVPFLDNFLEEWELESMEVVSRKILLVFCRVQLGGAEALQGVLDLEQFQEVLWDVLSDERHGIDAFPEMRRKCIQLFTLLGMHLQTPVSSSPGNITPPHNLSSLSSSQKDPNIPPTMTNEPRQLVSAGPLAEFVIKILCSHDHAGANDEADDMDLSNMHLNSSQGREDTGKPSEQPPVLGDLGGLNGKSEGGKCVSRIFRTHKHNVQLRYSCLSCIMHICENNRSIRRKVISSYSEIASNFSYLDPVRSMTPLLQLVALCSEYLSKVETAGEESIVTLLVRCLRYPDSLVRTLACEVIAVIGASSPGLMHRGICRPEVEDLLNGILLDMCLDEPQQHSGPLVCAVLKACNALTHDINVRPCWVPSPYTYHWSKYSMDLAKRPLFGVTFLDTLQLVVRRASRTYMIQYFSVVLSIVTCLMYSCNDGVFAPAAVRSAPNHVAELKAALISKFLPWMPVALDYLTSHKKIIRSMMVIPAPQHMNDGTSVHSSGHSSNNSPLPSFKDVTPPPTGSAVMGSAVSSSKTSTPLDSPSLNTASDAAAALSSTKSLPGPSKSPSGGTSGNGLNIMSRIKRKSNANMVVVENVVLPDRRQDVKYSISAEYLAEKLIEALHAFLCMDEMFPLSTYLQNATLFNITPVIACVSYFMTECKANIKVQRRGIDFIKHFADNQIGLSSIAMHSPGAIMHAARTLNDTLEVQYCFCKIVSAVARSDDFARENFIRFNVQSLLVELILRQHAEQSRLACIAITDLCVHDTDIFSVCQNSGVVDAVIALIDSMPNDFKIQVEGIRVLVTVDQIPDMLQATRKVSVSQILKRSKKILVTAMKSETLPDGYERHDLESLMNSPLWAKDPLITKFLGLFG